METIQKPQALKKVLVGIVNIILFIVYYYVLSFLAGLVAGIGIMLVGNDFDTVSANNTWLTPMLVTVALIVNIILAFIARRKIYFHVVDQTTNTVPVAAPVASPVAAPVVEASNETNIPTSGPVNQ